MSANRRNTLVVDFSTLPKHPVLDQVEEFIKKKLKLDMADVKSIQLHRLYNCVFIEMINASVAPRLQKHHHLRHSFVYQGVDYYVPVYVDGPSTTVKIHDLSPQMPNTRITDNLQQFGKVLSIQNDVWKNYFPGVPNGVRVVRMKIKKPLPSYIVVDGQRSFVSYTKERTASGTTEKPTVPQPLPSSGKEQNSNDNNECEPSSDHSDSDDDEDDDDDDSDSDGHKNDIETTEEPTGKRRLSTEAPNETMIGNEPKRSCNEGSQKVDKTTNSEWRVYQARSKKKCANESK